MEAYNTEQLEHQIRQDTDLMLQKAFSGIEIETAFCALACALKYKLYGAARMLRSAFQEEDRIGLYRFALLNGYSTLMEDKNAAECEKLIAIFHEDKLPSYPKSRLTPEERQLESGLISVRAREVAFACSECVNIAYLIMNHMEGGELKVDMTTEAKLLHTVQTLDRMWNNPGFKPAELSM